MFPELEALRFVFILAVFSAESCTYSVNASERENQYCSQTQARYGRNGGQTVVTDHLAKKHFAIADEDVAAPHSQKFYSSINSKTEERKFISEIENIFVNKCCPENSYFDVTSYNCASMNSFNLELPQLSIRVNNSNLSRHLYVENLPNCGNDSVLSVRIVSEVEVERNGIYVEGEFLFRYCLDENPSRPNETIILACHDAESFCRKKPCFRKCCPLKHSYLQYGRKCQETNYGFRPEFFQLRSLTADNATRLSQFGLYFGDACEKRGKYLLERDDGELSYLDSTGTLYVPMYQKCFAQNEFCIEHVKMDNFSGIGSFLCFTNNSGQFENSQLQYLLLSLGLIISSMFLLLTFLAYLFSPGLRNLYGKSLMCYIACLMMAYLSLAVVELKSTELTLRVCISMGYIILFSFLAAFFWLNVISYDIWKTFRTVQSLEASKYKKEQNVKFFRYSLYAWTFPCAITASCSILNEMKNIPFESIRPNIGEENCWFSRRTYGIYVFFIAPISVLIISNIIFYVQTAWKIWKIKADITKMGKQKRKKFTANKNQFLINGKLFIIMGITWSLEIISFFAPHPIWYVADAANALHGVFIFAVFVLKKRYIRKLFTGFCIRRKRKRKCHHQMSTTITKHPMNLQLKINFKDSILAPLEKTF